MKKQRYLMGRSIFLVFLFTAPVFGQDTEAALPSGEDVEAATPEEPEIPASQEVEINEDNYRQFMELRDANRQRDIIPENVFKPGSGLQKLEKLPEESQKHLRNELREIIVQGDPWQPGDEETEYPYTPSVAASTNPALEQQEKEAWGELVDSYHQRESQIYENSSGSQAARGSEQGSSDSPESGTGASGNSGQSEEGSQGQQAGQPGNPKQGSTEGTYSLNGSNDPNANSTTGVSQNAMEYLQGLGKGGGNTGDGNSETPGENGGQGESLTPSETGSQAQIGQQDSSAQDNTATSGSAGTARDPNATSTAGTSQNAMEFLKSNSGQGEAESEDGTAASQTDQGEGETEGESSAAASQANQGEGETQTDEQKVAQTDGQDAAETDGQAEAQADGQEQDSQQSESTQKPDSNVSPANATPVSSAETEEESTEGASQNALEYLTGEDVQAPGSTDDESNTVQPEGTLTIQDLLNARGVGDSTGTDPASTSPVEEQQPTKDKSEKDGDG